MRAALFYCQCPDSTPETWSLTLKCRELTACIPATNCIMERKTGAR